MAEASRIAAEADQHSHRKFYWPSDDYSVTAEGLCMHVPPSPNADHRCVRPEGHPGKHLHVIATWGAFRNHSHKDGPWVEWSGGICPVDCDLVEYKTRCHPHQVFGPTPPNLLRWDHGRMPDSSLKSSDIIAYRIVNS